MFRQILSKIRLPCNSRDLLHTANLRHGTDGFTSPPKEGVLRIFSIWIWCHKNLWYKLHGTIVNLWLLTLLYVLLTLMLSAIERKLFSNVPCCLLIILPPRFKGCILSLLAFVPISNFTISHALFFKFIIWVSQFNLLASLITSENILQ